MSVGAGVGPGRAAGPRARAAAGAGAEPATAVVDAGGGATGEAETGGALMADVRIAVGRRGGAVVAGPARFGGHGPGNAGVGGAVAAHGGNARDHGAT